MTTDHAPADATQPICSTVPARLDRLPWTRFHWRVVLAVGVTWVLDGVEITIAGSIADRLRDEPTALRLTERDGTVTLAGIGGRL